MTSVALVLITAFLAAAVEAVEMVTIVVGVGATRGWRSTLLGAGAGFVVLRVIVAALGVALSAIPIGPLRLVVGALLLVFGLQWLRKGVVRVAAYGLAGLRKPVQADTEAWTGDGVDWTAFVLAFKGVLLEGLEVAFIVVSIGANASQLGAAVIGGVGAVVVVGAIGAVLVRVVARIPRSLLQLVVGILLTTFGSFWAVEGLGMDWPGGDGAILGLLGAYVLTAWANIAIEHRHSRSGGRVLNTARAPGSGERTFVATQDHAARGAVKSAVSWLLAFGRFWYRFIIGDDWTVAAAVALGLVITTVLRAFGIVAGWLVPLIVMVIVRLSLQRSRPIGSHRVEDLTGSHATRATPGILLIESEVRNKMRTAFESHGGRRS